MKEHHYTIKVTWMGNQGQGTSGYTTYSRDHIYRSPGKPDLFGSSDPSYRGDASRYSPEDLLVCALSSCHMLWYLHFCSVNKIVVEKYEDNPTGIMVEEKDGNGKFKEVTLHPRVVISSGDFFKAEALHEEAHRFCFVANSVNFPINCEPEIVNA
ncbi:MAG: OsmC family protein [Bacteroidetes bacterium]|nr:OsmC family protein [Bacteroidota bacterium]MBS1981311.1 OsmC family protein [Bacteroidota bacterium]